MEVSTPTQAPREEGARSSPGAARGRCERPMMHQRPEDLWTRGFPSSGLRLCLGLGRSEVRVVGVGRAAPGLRKAEAAEAAEARTAQGPSRTRIPGVRPTAQVCRAGGGTRPCRQAEEEGPRRLSGVGLR